jgi:DNA polymerase III alpha subunit (gram-positive type)
MYLFFDTETTGLPKNYNAPVTDSDNWPRMVQIAWQMYDENHNVVESKEYVIKPEGYIIPKAVSDLHRVTQERAEEEGQDLEMVLNEFREAMIKSKYLVAHNISFDEKIVGAEFIRKKIEKLPFKIERLDTMKIGTSYCKLPGRRGYKWPKLMELHEKLFDEGFEEAHDALVDVKALAKCFFEMVRLGLIKIVKS